MPRGPRWKLAGATPSSCMRRQVGLQKSLDAAVQAYHRDGSEDALARICEIQGLLARSSQSPPFAETGD